MKKFDWKNLMKELIAWTVILVPVVLALFVLVFLPSRSSSPSPVPHSGSDSNPQISSSLSVVPKTNSDDLVVEHHYKATIDGETVHIPIRVVSSPSVTSGTGIDSSSSGQLSSDSGYTATYKQELDLTPLLSDYEHKTNWEVGVGVGCHDSDVYFPVSVQRNLSNDRAVEGAVHLSDSGKVNGGEVLLKKRF